MSDPTTPPGWVASNQSKAKQAFARVQQAKQQKAAPAAAKQAGSEQVRKSQPKPVLAPKGPARAAVDRQAHMKAKAKDNQAARQQLAAKPPSQSRAQQFAKAIKARQQQTQQKQQQR